MEEKPSTEKITKKLLEMFEKGAAVPMAEDDSQKEVPATTDLSRPGPSASPEPNCAICLEPLQNKSFTDSCFHTFCFTCLVEWSKVKPECPLCKQKFKSIVHNVQKDLTFQEYHITATAVAAQRFRYRTTRTWDQMVSHRMQYAPHSVPAHSFRRRVYAEGLWVRPVPSPVSRIVTPDFLQRNPACEVRLARWLRREAAALLLPREQQRHLVEQTLVLLRAVPLRSTSFADALRFNLGPRTAHFLHELAHFACSQYEDLEDYDRQAEYSALPSTHPAQPLIIPRSSSSDDEFLPQSAIGRPPDDDCHVVGVVKPRAERTPELVVLSSDEEEAVIDLSSDGAPDSDVECVYEEPRPSTSRNYFSEARWVRLDLPPGDSSSSPDDHNSNSWGSYWSSFSGLAAAGPLPGVSNPPPVERKPKLASAVVLPKKTSLLPAYRYRFVDSEEDSDDRRLFSDFLRDDVSPSPNDSVRSWRSRSSAGSSRETPKLVSLAANKSKIEKSWRSGPNVGSSRDSPIDSSAKDHGKSGRSRSNVRSSRDSPIDSSANDHGKLGKSHFIADSSLDLRIDSSANDHGNSGRSRSIADSSRDLKIDSSANDHGNSGRSRSIADSSRDLRIDSSANDYSKSGRSLINADSSRDSSRDSFSLAYDNGRRSHSIGDSSRELMIDSSANDSGKSWRSCSSARSSRDLRRDTSPSSNVGGKPRSIVVSSSRVLMRGGKSKRSHSTTAGSSRDLPKDSSADVSWRSGWKLQRESSSPASDDGSSSRKVKKLKLRSVGVVPGHESSSHRSSHKKHKHKKKKRLHKHRRRIASDSDSN